jgi:hypothetical protein
MQTRLPGYRATREELPLPVNHPALSAVVLEPDQRTRALRHIHNVNTGMQSNGISQRLEFLAKRLLVGNLDSHTVFLGTPIYVAMAE